MFSLRLKVKLGVHNKKEVKGTQIIVASKIISHEKYTPEPRWDNDIGLLKLSKKVEHKLISFTDT